MAEDLRDKNPESFLLCTIRTVESRLWMIPTRKMEKLLGGIIARYQELLSIEIYAYVFISNHYHLIIRAPKGNADEFFENVNREISRRLNWKYHREGTFWSSGYKSQPILSEQDLLEGFLYITTNPVHHGLVSHPEKWTGLSSYIQSLTSTTRHFTFHHYSARDDEPKSTRHALVLTPLPQFSDLSKEERRAKLERCIEGRTAKLVEKRKAAGLGFLGITEVLNQVPGTQPQNTSRSNRPCCYSKNPELIREYRKQFRELRNRYNEASLRFRLGDMNAIFPEFTYRPPLHRKPRLKPFQPLDESFLKKAA